MISLSILDNISKYESIINDGQPRTLRAQEEAIVEIANYIIENLPILIASILNYARNHYIADTTVWGIGENPTVSIRSQNFYNCCFDYMSSLMFSGSLVIGYEIRNRTTGQNMENTIKVHKIFDFDRMFKVSSADDYVFLGRQGPLDQFLRLACGIAGTALRINVPDERAVSIERLSELGGDILKKYRYW